MEEGEGERIMRARKHVMPLGREKGRNVIRDSEHEGSRDVSERVMRELVSCGDDVLAAVFPARSIRKLSVV